jgi:hypothetical protein
MKISFREANDLGLWDWVCEKTGISVWAVNEGQLDPDEEIDVNLMEDK